jgi:hypothetical protein
MDDIEIFGKDDFDAKKYINNLCDKRSDQVPVEKCVYVQSNRLFEAVCPVQYLLLKK